MLWLLLLAAPTAGQDAPRIALLVLSPDAARAPLELGARGAAESVGHSLVPAEEVLAARSFVQADPAAPLAPNEAELLRARLGAARLIVVEARAGEGDLWNISCSAYDGGEPSHRYAQSPIAELADTARRSIDELPPLAQPNVEPAPPPPAAAPPSTPATDPPPPQAAASPPPATSAPRVAPEQDAPGPAEVDEERAEPTLIGTRFYLAGALALNGSAEIAAGGSGRVMIPFGDGSGKTWRIGIDLAASYLWDAWTLKETNIFVAHLSPGVAARFRLGVHELMGRIGLSMALASVQAKNGAGDVGFGGTIGAFYTITHLFMGVDFAIHSNVMAVFSLGVAI